MPGSIFRLKRLFGELLDHRPGDGPDADLNLFMNGAIFPDEVRPDSPHAAQFHRGRDHLAFP